MPRVRQTRWSRRTICPPDALQGAVIAVSAAIHNAARPADGRRPHQGLTRLCRRSVAEAPLGTVLVLGLVACLFVACAPDLSPPTFCNDCPRVKLNTAETEAAARPALEDAGAECWGEPPDAYCDVFPGDGSKTNAECEALLDDLFGSPGDGGVGDELSCERGCEC